MHSAIYTGRLRHRRFAPREHSFEYRLFMMYVDLAELDQVFRNRWLWSVKRPSLAWLRRKDYLGDATVPLDQAVRDRVEAETGERPTGRIRMLTHLRYFGVGFNPVTFYYCFNRCGDKVKTIVAEITNTPWNERHVYVLGERLNISPGAAHRYLFRKEFHVSPFMPMNFDYDWRFGVPDKRLTVHMQNMQGNQKSFDATLDLQRREITGWSLAITLASFPAMTVTVIVGIYSQAFRLWLKRIPFHSHPETTHKHERHTRRSSIT
jgi:DUF1365 family protein